jgi:hypothetical protein
MTALIMFLAITTGALLLAGFVVSLFARGAGRVSDERRD